MLREASLLKIYMITAEALTSGMTAFIAGVITSPHCVGMCGPLGCLFLGQKNKPANNFLAHASYHSMRALSYCIIGATAGFIGNRLLQFMGITPIQYFPWFLAAFLFFFALGLEKYLPKPKWMGPIFVKISQKIRQAPNSLSGAALGLVTPFLPCAPLYLVFWTALLSGSPLFGAEISLGFALGTMPLLFIAQSQLSRLRAKLKPQTFLKLQRGLALLAGLIVVWRIMNAPEPMVSHCCGHHG